MKGSIYGVAYLLRKTGMTLTEIRSLLPAQLKELLEEVIYQEAVVDYQTASYVANLLAAIANTIPRKGGTAYTSSSFLKLQRPRRSGDDVPDPKAELEALATKFSINLPAREIVEY